MLLGHLRLFVCKGPAKPEPIFDQSVTVFISMGRWIHPEFFIEHRLRGAKSCPRLRGVAVNKSHKNLHPSELKLSWRETDNDSNTQYVRKLSLLIISGAL